MGSESRKSSTESRKPTHLFGRVGHYFLKERFHQSRGNRHGVNQFEEAQRRRAQPNTGTMGQTIRRRATNTSSTSAPMPLPKSTQRNAHRQERAAALQRLRRQPDRSALSDTRQGAENSSTVIHLEGNAVHLEEDRSLLARSAGVIRY